MENRIPSLPSGVNPARWARFWAKVDVSGECWIWTASRGRGGYGQFAVETGVIKASHRVLWEWVTQAPLSRGLDLCHHCDNPPCVRPAHLFEGTRSDNVQDMLAKGRDNYARGTEITISKLNEDLVRGIREVRKTGLSLRVIGEQFGVSHTTVRRICVGRMWAHVA